MLFDIYFNLGSFYLGICTSLACVQAVRPADARMLAIGTLIIAFYGWMFRWLLQRHSQEKGWSLVRRFAPLVCYAFGFLLPILTS